MASPHPPLHKIAMHKRRQDFAYRWKPMLTSGNHDWIIFSHVFPSNQRELTYAACGADHVVTCSPDARDCVTPNCPNRSRQFVHFFWPLKIFDLFSLVSVTSNLKPQSMFGSITR